MLCKELTVLYESTQPVVTDAPHSVITITSTLAPCISMSNASSNKHPLQSSIPFAFQHATLKAAGVPDAIIDAGAACSVCCLSALSRKVWNAATTDRLVNLRLPSDRVGLARQPFGCRQPVKLQMFALYLAFRPRTWQVGLGTAAKGLATQHLLPMLH